MSPSAPYAVDQPTRAEIDALTGPVLLQFGTDWCGYCRVAERIVEPALADFPDVRQVKVEDGRGRPLGRSFRIKLWPTLVLLRDGVEVARLVRPTSEADVRAALADVTSSAR